MFGIEATVLCNLNLLSLGLLQICPSTLFFINIYLICLLCGFQQMTICVLACWCPCFYQQKQVCTDPQCPAAATECPNRLPSWLAVPAPLLFTLRREKRWATAVWACDEGKFIYISHLPAFLFYFFPSFFFSFFHFSAASLFTRGRHRADGSSYSVWRIFTLCKCVDLYSMEPPIQKVAIKKGQTENSERQICLTRTRT